MQPMVVPKRPLRVSLLGRVAALLLLIAITLSGCTPGGEKALSNIKVSYIVSEPLDFIQHLVAHVDLGENAATNYDPAYVQRVKELKAGYLESIPDLEKELRSTRALGMDLVHLQVLGIYCENPGELVECIRVLAGEELSPTGLSKAAADTVASLSQRLSLTPDERQLITLFSRVAAKEYETFYREYHARNQDFFEKQMRLFTGFMSEEGLRAVAPSFWRGGLVKITVWLSETRRVNGLGLNYGGGMGAVVRLPDNEDTVDYSYFFLVHELTHFMSDGITYRVTGYDPGERDTASGTKGYVVHRAVEEAAILADYWMFKSASGDLAERYLEFCKSVGDRDPMAADLPTSLKDSLQKEFSRR
jgi:hypothetical protein